MGQRPHEPVEFHGRQMEAMAAYGIAEVDIARVLGIDPKTLRKYCRQELG
jgi:DNA-binding CsgD family transcriptional regulator